MVVYTGETVGIWNDSRTTMEEWWKLVRALRGGTIAMRGERTTYLPMTAQEQKLPMLYQARLAATRLLPAYSRAVTDLAAMPFQKAPTLTGFDLLPEMLRKIETNADREGTSLWAFFRQIHEDAIDRGLGLFLVDNVPPPVQEDGTAAPLRLDVAEQIDARPYFCRIHPDNLVGFVSERRYGVEHITDLRYRERKVEIQNGKEVRVDRVFHWTEQTISVWESVLSTSKLSAENVHAEAALNMQGGYVLKTTRAHGFPNGIPLVVHYTEKLTTLFAKPPLEDLAWENVAHWQCRSHQDDALKYCRSPILSGTGVDQDTVDTKPVVGAGATVLNKGESAKWSFVEISGQSLAAGREQLKEITDNMRLMALQPLVTANGPDTATGEVRADVRDKAMAQQWAEGLEWTIYRAFVHLAAWMPQDMPGGLPDDFDVALWRDWAILSSAAQQDVPALQVDHREGRVTLRTYLDEMKRRGKRRDSFDVDAELAELEEAKAASDEQRMQSMLAQIAREKEAAGGGEPEDEPDDKPDKGKEAA